MTLPEATSYQGLGALAPEPEEACPHGHVEGCWWCDEDRAADERAEAGWPS